MNTVVDTTVHCPVLTFGNVTKGNWEVKESEYQLGPKIGEGANAIIHKCQLSGMTCVAKQLKNGVDAGSQAYKDLVMELEILTSVQPHPNVVRFWGACIVNPNSPIIFEEFVDGPTLETYISSRNGSRLPKPTIFGWSLDLLRALDFLHNRDPIIIHRDLKPANLMLTKDLQTLKLADFGMSKKVERSQRDTKHHKGYTGTVRYMAPEVLSQRQGNYNEKADVFSASLIMWYIATSQRPPGKDLNEIRVALQNGAVPKSLHDRPPLSAVGWKGLEDIISRMWEHDPAKRPSAMESIEELNKLPDKPDISMGVAPKQQCCCVQ
ncbi:hypothetical protein GUITHDRAFT_72031 [Guillardia theta CCMP2712]|uniref:Protein kinase domain-containing protein n=1 Tax=Guillardia theta (strain CCMP2712) TaxID=905079 RepID=L1J997_GUITC|nr:hypothetical protein GUITHDRAFT_72031 [Guillardia theta CCMP2712]EKX44679.1 hypothetical protein GUITHDRAFT_72031 [Guillardia theta CCMP2712]|mmetsp:Transcript_29623/g.94830  ORF Transcript_29623/g.94830 Transcript_29623/m.94830 type:complete len:322 (-) Transcript_29623:188-1153(-)|eukprot:XP_005831659.1 hypothetical protein GUITHDRAFT_72031 [Guillardia theta CCMP2712]